MKRLIYIAIIVIGLGGAAVMAYLAFMGGGSSEEVVVVEGEAAGYNILPEGKTLDFNTLQDFNKDGRVFPYPVVSPAEVGQVLGNIIE